MIYTIIVHDIKLQRIFPETELAAIKSTAGRKVPNSLASIVSELLSNILDAEIARGRKCQGHWVGSIEALLLWDVK